MKKEDLTVAALLSEAVTFVVLLVYLGLQIYYGVSFHIPVGKLLINILLALLVYAGLTLLSFYPERVNSLSPTLCQGPVRKWTLRMLRIEKFLFIAGLMAPCIADAFGIRIDGAYSLLVIILIALVALFYEFRILKKLREDSHKDQ